MGTINGGQGVNSGTREKNQALAQGCTEGERGYNIFCGAN